MLLFRPKFLTVSII